MLRPTATPMAVTTMLNMPPLLLPAATADTGQLENLLYLLHSADF